MINAEARVYMSTKRQFRSCLLGLLQREEAVDDIVKTEERLVICE